MYAAYVPPEVEDEEYRLRRALTLAETILGDKDSEITDLNCRLVETRKRVEYLEQRAENEKRRREEECEVLAHMLRKARVDAAAGKIMAGELKKFVRMHPTHPLFIFNSPPLRSICAAGGESEKKGERRAGSLQDGRIHPSPTHFLITIIIILYI
ncbi:hypothetical protein Aduo_009368 [Ancylostoma duodenale]